MLIQDFSLERLLNATHNEFVSDVASQAKANANVSAKFATSLANLDAAVEAENNAYKLSRKSPLTQEIAGYNRQRDALYLTFQTAVRKLTRSEDEEMSKAAKRLWEQIIFFKVNTSSQYDHETGQLTKFCSEMMGKFEDDIKAIYMWDVMTALAEANARFCTLLIERDKADSLRVNGAMTAARENATQAYRNLVIEINGVTLHEQTTDYDTFIAWLNTYTLRLKRQALRVHASSPAATPDDVEQEVEEEEEGNTPTTPPEENTPTTPPEGETQQPTTPTTYTVTFMHRGEVYETRQYEPGETIVKPAAPSGYYWGYCPTVMPDSDVTVRSVEQNYGGDGV